MIWHSLWADESDPNDLHQTLNVSSIWAKMHKSGSDATMTLTGRPKATELFVFHQTGLECKAKLSKIIRFGNALGDTLIHLQNTACIHREPYLTFELRGSVAINVIKQIALQRVWLRR